MGLLQWLNSSSRKNWHVVVLNIIMGIIMSIIIIPTVVYFTRVVPTKYIFEGVVVDADTNLPIEGATVLFVGLANDNTNTEGEFEARETYRGDQPPKQEGDRVRIEITASGYKDFYDDFTLTEFRMRELKYAITKTQ